MSERDERGDRSCDGKRRYATKGGAREVVIRIARQQRDESIVAYRCRICGFWHVGHCRRDWQR